MLESMVEWMSYPLYYAFDGAAPPPRAGAAHATIYPYGPFPAGDGRTVMLGLQNEREWAAFCDKVLEQPELGDRPALRRRTRAARAAREELRAIIVEAFSRLTAEQVIARLDAAQIANARMNDMHDVWEHAQLKARERWVEVGTPPGAGPRAAAARAAQWVRTAHGRCARRWASTPTRSCASSATTMTRLPDCGRSRLYRNSCHRKGGDRLIAVA